MRSPASERPATENKDTALEDDRGYACSSGGNLARPGGRVRCAGLAGEVGAGAVPDHAGDRGAGARAATVDAAGGTRPATHLPPLPAAAAVRGGVPYGVAGLPRAASVHHAAGGRSRALHDVLRRLRGARV